jgi:hypothetical protein
MQKVQNTIINIQKGCPKQDAMGREKANNKEEPLEIRNM